MTEAEAKLLPAELEAEIAALGSISTYAQAIAAMNGRNGGSGIRQRFMNRLYAAQAAVPLSDPLFIDLANQINRACDDVIRPLVPVVDSLHAEGRGFSPLAIS